MLQQPRVAPVPNDKDTTESTQRGVKFPDGTIVWAEVGKDEIYFASSPSNPFIAVGSGYTFRLDYEGPKRYMTYTFDDARTRYAKLLSDRGSTYDWPVLEIVERQVLVVTTEARTVPESSRP